MNAPWWHQTLTGFDTETTGTDVLDDQIITAAISTVTPDGTATSQTFLLQPDKPIAPEATAVHGITDAHAREHGTPRAEGLTAIIAALAAAAAAGPVVAFNAAFDLTILAAEARRHTLPFTPPPVIIDPLVMDRFLNPYRRGKGSRQLGALCKTYDIALLDAHSADADAIAAVHLARKLFDERPTQASAADVHARQIGARRAQQADLGAYLGRDLDGGWPLLDCLRVGASVA